MSDGFSIGSNHSLFNISLDKAKGKNKPDNKIDYTEIVEAIRIGSTEEKDAAFKLISGLVNSSSPEDKKLWENFCALLSKDLDKKKNPAIEILAHLAKTAPDKAAELFNSIKATPPAKTNDLKQKIINQMGEEGCFDDKITPMPDAKNNVVKFLSEIASAKDADKYLLNSKGEPSEAAKFLFDNLDLAEGKNKSQTASGRYNAFDKADAKETLKKACIKYIGAILSPTKEQKNFFKEKVEFKTPYINTENKNPNVEIFNGLSEEMKVVYIEKGIDESKNRIGFDLRPGKGQAKINLSKKVIDKFEQGLMRAFINSGACDDDTVKLLKAAGGDKPKAEGVNKKDNKIDEAQDSKAAEKKTENKKSTQSDDKGRVLTMEKTADGKYKVTYTYTTNVGNKKVIAKSSFNNKIMTEEQINKEIKSKESKEAYKPYIKLLKDAKAKVDREKAEGATANNTPAKDTLVAGDASKNFIAGLLKNDPRKTYSEQEQSTFTTSFNVMNPADQAAVINAIMEDDDIDIEDIFVLEKLKLKPAAIGMVKNTERFLNIDSEYSANGIFGENYNNITKSIIKTHIETIDKAEDVKLNYSVSNIDEREKAVKKLEQELKEIEDTLSSNRLLPDQIRILENKKAAIKDRIQKIKDDIDKDQTAITGVSNDVNDKSFEVNKFETALDNDGFVPDKAPTEENLTSYATDLQTSYNQINNINAALGAEDNTFIADDDTNRWTAIANTLILLGLATKEELFGDSPNVNAIKAKLAKLAGKSAFGDVKSYGLAIRTLLIKIEQKKAKIAAIKVYMQEYKKINELAIDEVNKDNWKPILETILKMPAGNYRDRLLAKLNEKLEKLYRDNPKSRDLIGPALAKIKQVRAAHNFWSFDTSSAVDNTKLKTNPKVIAKTKIIELHNTTANSYTPRGKAVQNITYLLAGGKNSISSDAEAALNDYLKGTGQLEFKKVGDHYELIIKSDGNETNLGISITNEVAASFLGKSYVNLGSMDDSQIKNLLPIIVAKHQDNYKMRGCKSGQSLEMKVAIGDMEDWTNMTQLTVIDRATFKSLFSGGGVSYHTGYIYSRRTVDELREDYIERAKELLPDLDKPAAENETDPVTAFIKGEPPYNRDNLFLNYPGKYDELIELQNKLRLLKNNKSLIKTIGKPSGAADVKPEGEASASGGSADVAKVAAEIKVINTDKLTGVNKLKKYQAEMKADSKTAINIIKNAKKEPIRYYFAASKNNQNYLVCYDVATKEFYITKDKGGHVRDMNTKQKI